MKNRSTTKGLICSNQIKSNLLNHLILVMTTLLPIPAMSQCYEEGSGSCTTAPTIISGTVTWDGEYICINADLTITGTGSLTITGGSYIEIAADTEIKVNNGGVLTINGESVLYAGGDMWKRIFVKSGGSVIIDQAIIADALKGIYAQNGSAESVFQVSDAVFCNNEIGIHMDAITTSTLSSFVEGTEFYAPSLKAPKTGQVGDYGILIEDVYPTDYFVIGDGGILGTNKNIFTELNIAIRLFNSKVQVQNNEIFKSAGTIATMPDVYTQVVICATGDADNGSEAELWVGDAVLGSGLNNSIVNCGTAVLSVNRIKTYILSNEIAGTFDSGLGEFTMKRGIDLQDNLKDIEINSNRITNFNNFGIVIEDQGTINTLITNNEINTTGFSNPLAPVGILVNEVITSSTYDLTISQNLISSVKSGVIVQRIEAPLIDENEINFTLPSPASGFGYGIRLENCNAAEIYTNSVTGSCSSGCGTKVRPVFIESCEDFIAEGNAVFDGSLGFYIYQPSIGSNLICNEIHDCNIGMGLEDLGTGGIGPIGNSGLASDNSWYPASTANRVYCFGDVVGTDGDDLEGDWYFRDSPSEFNITDALTDFDIGSTDFNPSPTSYSSDPCYSIYRLGAATVEYALEELTWLYADMITGFTEIPTATPNQYHRYINFWKDVHYMDGLADILSDDVAEVYYTIETSNIPEFLTIKDSISNRSFAWALEENNSIIASNTIEEYWQQTNAIYLNNLDSSGTFQLNDEVYSELFDIANLPGGEYGEGVYNARGMLDLTLDPDFEIEVIEERFAKDKTIYLYPNPTQNYIAVIGIEPYDIQYLSILDLSGNRIFEKYLLSDNILDVGNLSVGYYIVHIITITGLEVTNSFIISK